MVVVALVAIVTKDDVGKKTEKLVLQELGGPCDNNKALLAYCDVFFSLFNSRVFRSYLRLNFSWSFT
jgi:hypothetical protein